MINKIICSLPLQLAAWCINTRTLDQSIEPWDGKRSGNIKSYQLRRNYWPRRFAAPLNRRSGMVDF